MSPHRCLACGADATIDAYWDPELWLCSPCAQALAKRLDEDDSWPPVDQSPPSRSIPDVPPHLDGRRLTRLANVMHRMGVRLDLSIDISSGVGVPVLSFTDPMARGPAEIASEHWMLLAGAWSLQGTHSIRICDHCRAPFLLRSGTKTRCPVCAIGYRTASVKIPFTEARARARRRVS